MGFVMGIGLDEEFEAIEMMHKFEEVLDSYSGSVAADSSSAMQKTRNTRRALAVAYHNVCSVFFLLNDAVASHACFLKAYRVDSSFTPLLIELASTSKMQGDTKSAEKYLLMLEERESDHPAIAKIRESLWSA